VSYREFINRLDEEGELVRITEETSSKFEITAAMAALGTRPVLFERVRDSDLPVAGNLFATRRLVARSLGWAPEEIIPRMREAVARPSEPEIVDSGPCQEVVVDDVDLDRLPILFHYPKDGGRYVTSGVTLIRDEELGHNAAFHRLMQVGKDVFTARVVPRHTHEILARHGGEMRVAVCVGNAANVLLAGATTVRLEDDELGIASAIEPLKVVKATLSDTLVPADCEVVLEGAISLNERGPEGPFVDLTGTYDVVRQEPLFKVERVTHRRDAIWHGLTGGGPEHMVLMGMPREPTIFEAVSQVVDCAGVHLTSGGRGWLHAVIQIRKRSEDDPRKAIEAAMRGHGSCKHVFVVDEDIDPEDPERMEFAMATRFQADRDLHTFPGVKGSSLDPSADQETRETCKAGFDLTKPLGDDSGYRRAALPEVDVERILRGIEWS
jgi:UbiD family decarboxylase